MTMSPGIYCGTRRRETNLKAGVIWVHLDTGFLCFGYYPEHNFPFRELRQLWMLINGLIRISKGNDSSGDQKEVAEVQVH